MNKLRRLIKHMWVHDGYVCNGYWQMTTEQKKLYRSITGCRHSWAVANLKFAREKASLSQRGNSI